jgi:type V secretion system putative substrate protein/coat protein
MNKRYRLVWNAVRQAMVAAPECARGRGKESSPFIVCGAPSVSALFSIFGVALAIAALLAVGLFFGAEYAMALVPAAAPAASRPNVAWGRKREPAKTFLNVGANQTAYSIIPRYPRTLYYVMLEKGGTTFTDAQLTRVEMFLGEKSIWGPLSAADIRMVDRYLNGAKEFGGESANDPFGTFLMLDFTNMNIKELGGEFIGGLDLSTLPDGQLRIEVDIAGATAPSLKGHFCWGPPQGGVFGALMRKLIKRTYPAQPAGDFYPIIDVRGAILCRQFWKGGVFNAVVATAFALATEGRANIGNGAVSGTVPALTPAGRYIAVCAKVGTSAVFEIVNPKGKVIGCVTSAAGALPVTDGPTLTITDGGTAWTVGDAFWIDVLKPNEDGNTNLIEIKKNEDFWYFRTERALRQEQQRYGRMPLAGLLVADFLTDNHGDSFIDTADAATLDYRLNFTATDTPLVIHEILAKPILSQ